VYGRFLSSHNIERTRSTKRYVHSLTEAYLFTVVIIDQSDVLTHIYIHVRPAPSADYHNNYSRQTKQHKMHELLTPAVLLSGVEVKKYQNVVCHKNHTPSLSQRAKTERIQQK